MLFTLYKLHDKLKSLLYKRCIRCIRCISDNTQTCNSCGHIRANLKLEDRRWRCPNCHTEQDRDRGAAINILREGAFSLGLGDVSQDFGFAITV